MGPDDSLPRRPRARGGAAGSLGPALFRALLSTGLRGGTIPGGGVVRPASPRTGKRRPVPVLARNAAVLRAVPVLPFRSAAGGVWRKRYAEHRHSAARDELVAGRKLRDSHERVPQRARFFGLLGRVGIVRVSSRTEAIWMGNARVRRERRGSHRVWTLPLCGGR